MLRYDVDRECCFGDEELLLSIRGVGKPSRDKRAFAIQFVRLFCRCEKKEGRESLRQAMRQYVRTKRREGIGINNAVHDY
jgi:hypothetical protein